MGAPGRSWVPSSPSFEGAPGPPQDAGRTTDPCPGPLGDTMTAAQQHPWVLPWPYSHLAPITPPLPHHCPHVPPLTSPAAPAAPSASEIPVLFHSGNNQPGRKKKEKKKTKNNPKTTPKNEKRPQIRTSPVPRWVLHTGWGARGGQAGGPGHCGLPGFGVAPALPGVGSVQSASSGRLASFPICRGGN